MNPLNVDQAASPVPSEAANDGVLKETELQYDPLLQCLVISAKRYSRPVSIDSLIAGLPVQPDQCGPEMFSVNQSKAIFSRVASRAGFSSRLIQRELTAISELLLPCILLLKDRKACVITDIDVASQTATITTPELPDGEDTISLDQLSALHTGFAFLLKPHFSSHEKKVAAVAQQGHWFWGTLKRSKDLFYSTLLASVLINLFVVATPLFTMNVYDRVVPNDALETLWVLAIGLFIVYGFDTLLRIIRTYLLEVAGKKTDVIMSSILFEQVLNLKMEHWPKSVGAFAANLRDFDSIRNFFTASTLTILVDVPFAIIFLAVIGLVGGWLVAIPLGIIAAILLYSFIIEKPLQQSIESTYTAAANKNAHLIESLNAIHTVKTLGASHHAQWVWEESTGEIASKSMRTRLLSSSIQVLTQFLMQLSTVFIIIAGVYQITDLNLSLGGLIAVVMLASRAIAPMGQVANLVAQYQQTKAAYSALNDIMHQPVERQLERHYVRPPAFKGHIRFDDVSFQYPETDTPVLKQVSLIIEPGEKVGIIGKVGSGKTTFAKLLTGLYSPEGLLTLDELNVAHIDPADLRRYISYVSQDVQLFRGSIRDNMVYRNPQVDDERFLQVARIAGIDQFIHKLSSGYDTPAGEQGAFLSGGQRQSIALARALMLDEPIVILDEPTSQMDNATESFIRQQLHDYTRSKTLLLITHKMPMLELVDRLIVMDEGRVMMDGDKNAVLKALAK